MMNRLYYGDNLDILRSREYFPDECVDLIYLDPPFNSSRSYNVLFKDESGADSEAQITAFEDTWHWGPTAEETYRELVTDAAPRVGQAIAALVDLVGRNQMMAYLVMMAARLVELHRVLKPDGSLYLHCDSTASHYLKIILDTIFGPENFRNEIVWKRTSAHSNVGQGARHYGRITDTIFFYSKGSTPVWNQQYSPYDPAYVERDYRRVDEQGRRYRLDNIQGPGGAAKGNPFYEVMGVSRYWRYSKKRMEELIKQGRVVQTKPGAVPQYKRYLDEMPGVPVQNLWDDVRVINNRSKEYLGYPTQKPIQLLERIIETSSNPGDVVLDPFCGCGTAVAAAHKLDRQWIGIDVTHLSVSLMQYRLGDMFDLTKGEDYEVIGEPETVGGARMLAEDDRFQFQFWALSLIQARPLGGQVGSRKGHKGADRGIDGLITFIESEKKKPKQVIIQVKSGKVGVGDIRDLVGTVEREKEAVIGVFITLQKPTKPMMTEALSAGYYKAPGWQRDYPKIQILTIEELLDGKTVETPSSTTFKQAQRIKDTRDQAHNLELFPDENK